MFGNIQEKYSLPSGIVCYLVEVCASTNDVLKKAVRIRGLGRPLVLWTEKQTAGRGTQGNVWQSDLGDFSFSLALPLSEVRITGSLIPAAAGVGVVEALTSLGIRCEVKWPNDIWLREGKAGGILCEIIRDNEGTPVLVIGIGINREGKDFLTGNGWAVSGVASAENPQLDRKSRRTLVSCVTSGVLDALKFSDGEVLDKWKAYDAFCGRSVSLKTVTGMEYGVVEGIDEVGRLSLLTKDGVKLFINGHITNDHFVN